MKPALLSWISIVMLIMAIPEVILAQENAPKTLEEYLELSLDLAADGKWDEALESLEKAREIAPEDPRIEDYSLSIKQLRNVDEAQNAWDDGKDSEVESVDPEDQGSEESPRFVIDRKEGMKEFDPIKSRDLFRGMVGLKMFYTISKLTNQTYSFGSIISPKEFAYSYISSDLRFWFPFFRRILGVTARSLGYSWQPGNTTFLFNTLDFGVNIRGFLAESMSARMELGLDFGGSMQSKFNIAQNLTEYSGAVYLGIWVSEPLFYHLFKIKPLAGLLFGAGLRIYTTTGEELVETLTYHFDVQWRFKNVHVGFKLNWWDFNASGGRQNLISGSIFSGVQF